MDTSLSSESQKDYGNPIFQSVFLHSFLRPYTGIYPCTYVTVRVPNDVQDHKACTLGQGRASSRKQNRERCKAKLASSGRDNQARVTQGQNNNK